ncbi:hypothetical protein [Hymenobacter latericus]|uniref:hypothetical protein n=1 Tax=Hymenobacter sp. YIM 151858-1 TaxID=2987688 RepID=UPI002226CB4D|nr:hypothetical protein [Hymenobacter sp. YIM 151858-1]UYZ60211.1 hypothetical protein OIS50_05275 [Hymenobacter sp. YIM 151858-1]
MSTQLAPIVGPEAATSVICIQKAKLKNGLLYAEFSEQHEADAPARTFTMQGTVPVHADLQHCFACLVPHLCLLTEQLVESSDYWPEDEAEELPGHFAGYAVTGFSIGRNGGVTLIGQRELKGGKVLNLTSPYVAYDDETGPVYDYAGLLETAMLEALAEVEAALRGKRAEAGRQLDLFSKSTGQELLIE